MARRRDTRRRQLVKFESGGVTFYRTITLYTAAGTTERQIEQEFRRAFRRWTQQYRRFSLTRHGPIRTG